MYICIILFYFLIFDIYIYIYIYMEEYLSNFKCLDNLTYLDYLYFSLAIIYIAYFNSYI